MPVLPDTVVRARFGLVAAAARENVGAAIDMILVHNEKEVRGRQPRASLNRAVVVTAIGAWDRFVADTRHAFTSTDFHWGSGLDLSNFEDLYARRSAELLAEAGAIEPFFWQRLRLVAATNRSGVRMRGMETLTGDHPGQRSGLTFSQHLNQWVTVRNALALEVSASCFARLTPPRRGPTRASGPHIPRYPASDTACGNLTPSAPPASTGKTVSAAPQSSPAAPAAASHSSFRPSTGSWWTSAAHTAGHGTPRICGCPKLVPAEAAVTFPQHHSRRPRPLDLVGRT